MIASHICKTLYEWIYDEEKQGTIHSIFKNTINILGEDNRLISVITGNKPMCPNGIKVDTLHLFDARNINLGEEGRFTKNNFISKHLNIYYGNCILWDKRIHFSYEKDNLKNLLLKLQLMGKFILYHGNKNGILTIVQSLKGQLDYADDIFNENYILGKQELFIKDRFLEFIKSFQDSNIDVINIKAKRIIGFGQGLTPAMDDFISGMMIANIYIAHFLGLNIEKTYSFNSEIIKDIEERTTLVSQDMLKSSSIGEANEDIKELMMNLVGTSTVQEIYRLFNRVAELGHSSGTDILCGIYIGSYILIKNKEGE